MLQLDDMSGAVDNAWCSGGGNSRGRLERFQSQGCTCTLRKGAVPACREQMAGVAHSSKLGALRLVSQSMASATPTSRDKSLVGHHLVQAGLEQCAVAEGWAYVVQQRTRRQHACPTAACRAPLVRWDTAEEWIGSSCQLQMRRRRTNSPRGCHEMCWQGFESLRVALTLDQSTLKTLARVAAQRQTRRRRTSSTTARRPSRSQLRAPTPPTPRRCSTPSARA